MRTEKNDAIFEVFTSMEILVVVLWVVTKYRDVVGY